MSRTSARPHRVTGAPFRLAAACASLLTACCLCLTFAAGAFAWAPTNVSPPTITGTAQQGKTLTEHHGEWLNFPTGYTYQWLRCNSTGGSCASIKGATGEAYVPVAEDVGHELRVDETAFNPQGFSSSRRIDCDRGGGAAGAGGLHAADRDRVPPSRLRR